MRAVGLYLMLLPVGGACAQDIAFDRPGIGFSASVLAPGQVAWEQGLPDLERNRDDGVRTTEVTAGSALRVGLGASLELQLSATPWQRMSMRDGGGARQVSEGAGDSSVGLKWALPSTGALDWALLARYGLATGSRGLRPDTHLRSLGASVEGETEGGRGYALFAGYQHDDDGSGWQVAPSLDLFEAGTLAGYVEAGVGGGTQAGTVVGSGLTWRPRPQLQFDLSVLRGVGGDAPDWQGGFGVAVGFR
ncbi:transporter [Luteimonas sp. S4-F44]|uniref:transporter n=1 Tax=Luteimonas sp. S4-F44 TaxID=2925842 RepID=UPI001F539DB8|nr:transporter [Luteimonas sp. S4-F44]UNK44121.1 transporter [Luteimonas sp. S4-F44]